MLSCFSIVNEETEKKEKKEKKEEKEKFKIVKIYPSVKEETKFYPLEARKEYKL